ncbi:MAG: glycosyltransferase [Candidatus Nomurabacteria bacterium]|jgi:glycosyltransferase involved in cell wall biosynthesis|nr:glycosyltransferase [Candidatus Nomurabacteria bacterium]
MKIGLFTDTYHPASNGVVVVIDILRRELERLGHEVFIFAPDGGVVLGKLPSDAHIIRLPAVQYDLQLSLFFPPHLLQKVRALDLDVIHFFTPAQLGLMATLAARKTNAVLVGQHSTDTYEFSKNYPAIALSYIFGGLLAPVFVRLNSDQKKRLVKLYLTLRHKKKEKWSQNLIAGLMSLLYANCDGVVAVSQKSANQLNAFAARGHETLNLKVIPTGANLLPPASARAIEAFRRKWKIAPEDEVVVYFGRMAEEKNLTLLIKMLPILLKKRPHAKLLMAGDYVYRKKLEKIAMNSSAGDKIIFTGLYQRSELSTICAVSKVFAFPSLTDTQALVLNEAAGLGLPIVMCDKNLNEVFRDGENGWLVRSHPGDFAAKINQILADEALWKTFSQRSRKLATQFSESAQVEKLVDFYHELLSTVVLS